MCNIFESIGSVAMCNIFESIGQERATKAFVHVHDCVRMCVRACALLSACQHVQTLQVCTPCARYAQTFAAQSSAYRAWGPFLLPLHPPLPSSASPPSHLLPGPMIGSAAVLKIALCWPCAHAPQPPAPAVRENLSDHFLQGVPLHSCAHHLTWLQNVLQEVTPLLSSRGSTHKDLR